ncbi:vomeronasal type-1 receptor, partial [Cricetulus griseus]
QKKLPRHSHDAMTPNTLAGTLFTVQTVAGILANFSLLHHYVTLCVTGFRFKSTDVIVQHLTVANALIMLSKGIPQTMTALGVKYFLHEFGCISVLYIYRVARGVSITATCILSVFQAIKMSSMTSSCKKLPTKALQDVGVSIFLCWILYMCVNLIFPLYSHSRWKFKNITRDRDPAYCSAGLQNRITNSLYIALVLFPEVSCSGLMLWSSGTMVCILHRHRRKMQYIHKARLSSRPSPEARATQSILALVCTFVFFYTLSSTFYAYIAAFNISSKWLMNTSALISTCFPTISPLLLMNRDGTVTRLWTKFRESIRFMSHLSFSTNFRFLQRPVCNSIRKTEAS